MSTDDNAIVHLESQNPSREDLLKLYFLGRPDVFAQENRGGEGWSCIRRELPSNLLTNHLQGRITLGTYPVNTLGNTPWLCFDIDEKSKAAQDFLLWLYGWFTEKEMVFLVEDTGGRGLHGWVLFLCWVPAEKAIALASLAIADYEKQFGVVPCRHEVFPKQAKPKDVGNSVRLPWGKHRIGKFSHFTNLNFEADDEGAIKAIENGRKITEFALDKVVPETAAKPRYAAKGKGHTPNEVVEMARRPLLVGERRPTLVKLAGYLRFRGISEEVAVALLLPWAEKCFTEPLLPEELERHIRGIYSRYGARERRVAKPGKSWHAEVPL